MKALLKIASDKSYLDSMGESLKQLKFKEVSDQLKGSVSRGLEPILRPVGDIIKGGVKGGIKGVGRAGKGIVKALGGDFSESVAKGGAGRHAIGGAIGAGAGVATAIGQNKGEQDPEVKKQRLLGGAVTGGAAGASSSLASKKVFGI